MNFIKSFQQSILNTNESNFEFHALEVFRFQAQNNIVYQRYLDSLNIDVKLVTRIDEIPFLPIDFFKKHRVVAGNWKPEVVFESSGTTGAVRSKHEVIDKKFYQKYSSVLFENTFGTLNKLNIMALLPSYDDRKGSSLISMVSNLIKLTKSKESGFFLNDIDALVKKLMTVDKSRKTILFGVTFALLDLAEIIEADLSNIVVIDTGGMKGRREEVTKNELYGVLQDRLNITDVYSEYGMTELMSQAYGYRGEFVLPEQMRVRIRETNDPFSYVELEGKVGAVNIIDLANVHSCAFIETQDLGRMTGTNSFEILGRMDNSEIRGCNLMVS